MSSKNCECDCHPYVSTWQKHCEECRPLTQAELKKRSQKQRAYKRQRATLIFKAWLRGETYERIATRHRISKGRVAFILHFEYERRNLFYRLPWYDGGIALCRVAVACSDADRLFYEANRELIEDTRRAMAEEGEERVVRWKVGKQIAVARMTGALFEPPPENELEASFQ